MENKWKRRRILIWGKTRPELSKTYREIVCTGGIFEDTKSLVRLYPIPLRYMNNEQVFKKYQWIEASVTKSSKDPRPESYRIRIDDIKVGETLAVKGGNWDARAEWVLQPHNIFQSVEAIQTQQKNENTSLGLVKPATVSDVRAERLSQREREKFWQHYEDVIRQMELPLDPDSGREIKPLKPPDYRFKVKFRCEDERCLRDHNFGVLDWEVDALYFNLRQRGDSQEIASSKVVEKIRDEICAADKDLYFFLGNISNHPNVFTIVSFWWPKKKAEFKQTKLF
jgi:hypothetical protein